MATTTPTVKTFGANLAGNMNITVHCSECGIVGLSTPKFAEADVAEHEAFHATETVRDRMKREEHEAPRLSASERWLLETSDLFLGAT